MSDERDKTRQPARVLVGHCPECRDALVVENNYEVWPLVYCRCGWVGPTTDVENRARYENFGYVADAYHPDVTA